MTSTLSYITPLKKQVIPRGPNDFDAYLEDDYVGSFPDLLTAWAELDAIAFEQLRRGLAAGSGALMSLGTPAPLVVANSALMNAYRLWRTLFVSPQARQRALSALLILAARQYTVLEGAVAVQGSESRPYHVTDHTCPCSDMAYRDGAGGFCKHRSVFYMLAIAQKLGPISERPGRSTPLTVVSLSAEHLSALLLFGRMIGTTPGTVSLRMIPEDGQLTLTCGSQTTATVETLRLASHDRALAALGGFTLTLPPDAFTTLWHAYRAAAKTHDPERIELWVDRSTARLHLLADDLDVQVEGRLARSCTERRRR